MCENATAIGVRILIMNLYHYPSQYSIVYSCPI